MSVNAPQNTLAYQRKGRPLALKRDLSDANIAAVSKQTRLFSKSGIDVNVKPEAEALWFYLLNHAVSEIEFRFDPDEPLTDAALWVLTIYNEKVATIAARAFYYLLLITCRESRHCHKKSEVQQATAATWGQEAGKGLSYYPDQNSVEAVCNVFDSTVKNSTLRQVTEVVRASFYTSGAYSGGYGGPAWGAVSDCLVSYVTGEYSAEMMADTVWTLCHNNGPIFNKGMLYGMYDSSLKEILDVQRSGQIPQLIRSKGTVGKTYASHKNITSEMIAFVKKMGEAFPDSEAFNAKNVDWNVVHTLGSLSSYTAYGATAPHKPIKPVKKKLPGGPSPDYDDMGHVPKQTESPMTTAVTGAFDPHKVFALGHHPGLMFKKISRKELQANGQ